VQKLHSKLTTCWMRRYPLSGGENAEVAWQHLLAVGWGDTIVRGGSTDSTATLTPCWMRVRHPVSGVGAQKLLSNTYMLLDEKHNVRGGSIDVAK
jgi:hypothetical protein